MDIADLVIGVVGILIGAISVILAYPRKGNWWRVERAVKELIRQIHLDHFVPDVVVLYGRGGAVFGALLAGNLGIIRIMSLDRTVVDERGPKSIDLIYSDALHKVRGKKVLLVQGEVVTGYQLGLVKQELEKHEPEQIRTAAYYVCRISANYPDFYYKETKAAAHVPWRILDQYQRDSKPGWMEE